VAAVITSRVVAALATAFIALIPFGWSILPANMQFGDVLLPALLAALVITGWRYRAHALDVAVLAFLITSAASVPGSLSPPTSGLAVGKELYLAGVYISITAVAERLSSVRLCRWIVTSAAWLSVASIAAALVFLASGHWWTYLGEPMQLPYVGGVFRARGTLLSPELFGNLLTFVAPLTLLVIARSHGERRWWAAGAVILVAELMTFSKSLGGFAVALAAMLWPRYPGRPLVKTAGATAAVGLVVLFNVSALVTIRQVDVMFGKNPDLPAPNYAYVKPEPGASMLDVRVSFNPMSYYLIKKVEWTAFRRRPWTGIGLSAFPFESERAFNEGRLHSPYQRVDAHSTPVGRLAETGLVGVAGLIALVVAVWRTGLAALRRTPGDDVAWALMAGCLGLFVNSINVDMMHFRFFWFGIGILRSLSR
jgi:hypothetical protein